jgi:hypothetical protein
MNLKAGRMRWGTQEGMARNSSRPAASEDDRKILNGVFRSSIAEIKAYLGTVDEWIAWTENAVAETSPPNRFLYLLDNLSQSVRRDLEFLSTENEYAIALDDLNDAVSDLTGAIGDYNDLRWLTNGGPQLEIVLKSIMHEKEEKEVGLEQHSERDESERARKLELIQHAKKYGVETFSQLLLNEKYNADLERLIGAIRSECASVTTALKGALDLTRKYELLFG